MGTSQWVLSPISKSHVTHINKSWAHINESWHKYQWVMAYISMSHGIHMDETRHSPRLCSAQEPCCSLIDWADIPYLNESCQWVMRKYQMLCHTYQSVMAYIWMRRDARRLLPLLTGNVFHICMTHVTHINGSCHTHQWVMPHTSMSHATAKISRNSKISVRTRFEQKKSLGLFPEKEVHIGCVSPRRLHFKRRILLGNLIGPSYLELRV